MDSKTQIAPEKIKDRRDVQRALDQAGAQKISPVAAKPKERFWLWSYLIALAAVGGCYLLVEFGALDFAGDALSKIRRIVIAAFYVILIMVVAKAVQVYLIARVSNPVSRYNLKRILRLVTGMVLILTTISFLFVNWYAAVVSLGLISLILGFALQTPISSFIAWIYILVREPYRVGDRIKIGQSTGDVIDVSYLDTTLWEFGGDYLSTDHPSGRIIKFPNATVLNGPVYNYSWPLFPYIWNEIKFQVAYESDLEFVATVMREEAEKEVGETMKERIKVFRELLGKTHVDHLEVREHPAIVFRINENTWVEAAVRYLVDPKESGRVKTRLIRNMLSKLNAHPDRVLFPKSNSR